MSKEENCPKTLEEFKEILKKSKLTELEFFDMARFSESFVLERNVEKKWVQKGLLRKHTKEKDVLVASKKYADIMSQFRCLPDELQDQYIKKIKVKTPVEKFEEDVKKEIEELT